MLKCGVPCTSEVHIWVAHELRVGPAWTLDHDTGLHSTGRKQVQRSQIASASKSEIGEQLSDVKAHDERWGCMSETARPEI